MAVDIFYGLHGGKGEVLWAEADDGVFFVLEVEMSGSEGVGAVIQVGEAG